MSISLISASRIKDFCNDDPNLWRCLVKSRIHHKKFLDGNVLNVVVKKDGLVCLTIKFDEVIENEEIKEFSTKYFDNEIFTLISIDKIVGMVFHDLIEKDRKHKEKISKEKELEFAIADLLKDYRKGEIAPITDMDVARWADQFNYKSDEDRYTFLNEIFRVFKSYYFSEEKQRVIFKKFIDNRIKISRTKFNDPKKGILSIGFLDANQKYGNSQKYALKILDEILMEELGVSTKDCKGNNQFFYIDDCLFSGVRLQNELKDIQKNAIICENAMIQIWYPFYHVRGYYEIKEKKMDLNYKYIFSEEQSVLLDNRIENDSPMEMYFPVENDYSDDISTFRKKITSKNYNRIHRYKNFPRNELVFSSKAARELTENLLLDAGSRILNQNSLHQKLRPLGFDHKNGWGFGSLFISFRNISNNTPIAFWFDGSKYDWFPLFKRKNSIKNKVWS
jgi:hypothetical protein